MAFSFWNKVSQTKNKSVQSKNMSHEFQKPVCHLWAKRQTRRRMHVMTGYAHVLMLLCDVCLTASTVSVSHNLQRLLVFRILGNHQNKTVQFFSSLGDLAPINGLAVCLVSIQFWFFLILFSLLSKFRKAFPG